MCHIIFQNLQKEGSGLWEGRTEDWKTLSQEKQFNRCKLKKKIINHSYSLEISLNACNKWMNIHSRKSTKSQ